MAPSNHVANLEALLKIVDNGMELLVAAWEGPAAGNGFSKETEAEFNKLSSKLQGIQKLAARTLVELKAGRGEAELDDLDLRVKDAGRTAERLHVEWVDSGDQAEAFLGLLSEAADVTVGPVSAATISWLVASAVDVL